MTPQLIDQFNRKIDYIRLSVTDRCDFRCVYCMSETMTFLPRAEVLSLEELLQVATAFVGQGVRRIRITGGEPLLSEADLAVFVAAFKQGGFTAPCHWYQNFTRNWATTEQVEQRVRQPALMIYGQYDMVRQADMSAYVPDLEVHTLPCGHWIQQEQPEATNRLLLDWLERRMRPLV